MATQVRETSAGKSISAYVVLNKKGEHVATVQGHYSNSGRVTVDVWNVGDRTTERCLAAAVKCGAVTPAELAKAVAASEAKRDWGTQDHEAFAAYDMFGMQQSSAGGGGYDKFAAALAGLWIDGQQMADHCGSVANAAKAKAALLAQYCKFHDYSGEVARAAENGWDQKYWDKRAAKIGARFTNWSQQPIGSKSCAPRYTSLHFQPGLERLETLGYKVIQAI